MGSLVWDPDRIDRHEGDASGDFLKCLLQGFGVPWIKPQSSNIVLNLVLAALVLFVAYGRFVLLPF